MDVRTGKDVEYRLLKQFDETSNTRIYYRRYNLHRGTSDRDGLVKQQIQAQKNGDLFAMRLSVDH